MALGLAVAVGAAISLLAAPGVPARAAAQSAGAASGEQPYDSSLFAALKWREVGPYRGGRSVAVAGSDARPYEYWMGTTGGGVFKTTDGGHDWKPVSDGYFGGTIGAIGVSESNPDIVYVGTGEYDIRGNVSHGDGVWKTTDGGRTWTHVGLADTRQIARVKVDPRDPDVVYVGALGHVWGPNAERGVFKTTDGGKSWKKILFRDDSTGVTDLVLDPNDPNTIYAAFWRAGRKPWLLVSGGAGSGIFKSTDAGEHWTEITRNPGLPKGIIGNIGITVSKASSNVLYANIEADSGGVFRSSDGGKTWTRTNEERKLRQRAWYYTRIFADPADTNTVYVLNVGFWRSTDGGRTFESIRVPHGDNHDLWIASNDAKRMIEGNDGGANVSFDAGRSWSAQDYATAQFYHVTTTTDFPYRICGAQQDNSTLCGPSAAPGGITMADWHDAGGGESGYIQVRPDSTNIVYAGSYAYLSRLNTENGQQRNIIPWPDNPMGHAAKDLKYRFQWTFPILISPHDPNTLYMGSNGVFRTRNAGQSWDAISPDLTRHDPATLGSSGGPITKDNTSVEYYATVFAIAESPLPNGEGTIWTGSDDGLIHLTRDGGAHWTDVTPKELPPWTRISIIEASHFDLGTAYVAANRYQLDDNEPYLYRTTDFGRTWKRIDAGMARDQFTRVIREDPERRGLLYAGTERGVWVSFDDGADWQPLRLGLPPVPVHDLAVTRGDLVAATHGRSFWILDDLSPLRQLSREVAAANAHLFEPRDVYRVQWGGGFGGGSEPEGANPPSGAVVYFTLAEAKEPVELEFLDASGEVIKSFSSELDSAGRADSVRADSARRARSDSLEAAGLGADSIRKLERAAGESAAGGGGRGGPTRVPNARGLNRFVWDLRYPDATGFENLIMWAGSTRGPTAVPGEYSVRMKVNGRTQTQSFALLGDPRISATQRDLEEQFALLIRIRDTLSAANDAVKTIRGVKEQIDARKAGAPKSFASAAAPFVARLSAIEDSIYQTKNRSGQDPLNYPIRLNNKIAALGGVVASADFKPTDQSYTVFDTLTAALNVQLVALRRALTVELAKLNAILEKAGRPAVTVASDRYGDSGTD